MTGTFRRQDMQTLLIPGNGPHLSLFMPTHRAGPETQQNPIRFKNLISTAREQLPGWGSLPASFRRNFETAETLVDDFGFWQYQADGFALFVNADGTWMFHVPRELPESASVSDRFDVTPLLPLLSRDGQFYVLAVSRQATRLLRGTRDGVSRVSAEGLPGSLREVSDSEPEQGFQMHTLGGKLHASPGGLRGVSHGHERADQDDDLERYFRAIDDAVARAIGDPHVPLVFAGVEELFPFYKEATTHDALCGEFVRGNPDGLSDAELHEQAWKIVRPILLEDERRAAKEFRVKAETDWADRDVANIIAAARLGAVETLLVCDDPAVLQRPTTTTAMTETLQRSGDVLIVPRVELNGAEVGALYRHPQAREMVTATEFVD